MSLFARCLRSWAAETPAKYELDIIQVTEKIGLATPTTGR